jgi:MFS family permease
LAPFLYYFYNLDISVMIMKPTKTDDGTTTAKATEEWLEDEARTTNVGLLYAEFEKRLTILETVKVFRCSIFWILYAQLVIFGYGIDGVIASSLISIPRFREDYGEQFETGSAQVSHIIPAKWQSAWAGVSQLTAILGAAGVGYLADKIGRRYTNAILCLVSIGGVCGQYFSRGSLGIMTAGKAINGFSIGGWLIIAPLYASEVAPLKLRGWLIALTNVMNFLGLFIFFGVMYRLAPLPTQISYKVPIALQWIVPGAVLLTIYFFPESPYWLARRGRQREALQSISRIYGSSTGIDHQGMLAQIESTIAHERSASGTDDDNSNNNSYLECFDNKNRKRTLITIFAFASLQFGGNIFVLGYQSYYYQLMGFDTEKSFMLNIISFALMFTSTILSWPLMAIAGRRPIIVYGSTLSGLCMVIVGAASIPGTYQGYIAVISFMFAWVSCPAISISVQDSILNCLSGLYYSPSPTK